MVYSSLKHEQHKHKCDTYVNIS